MNLGSKITSLRKAKNISQTDLAKAVGVSREIIGNYQRGEAAPSVEVSAKIADVLDASLDYLAENTDLMLGKNVVNKIMNTQKLGAEDKAHVFDVLDVFLHDYKTKKACAQ